MHQVHRHVHRDDGTRDIWQAGFHFLVLFVIALIIVGAPITLFLEVIELKKRNDVDLFEHDENASRSKSTPLSATKTNTPAATVGKNNLAGKSKTVTVTKQQVGSSCKTTTRANAKERKTTIVFPFFVQIVASLSVSIFWFRKELFPEFKETNDNFKSKKEPVDDNFHESNFLVVNGIGFDDSVARIEIASESVASSSNERPWESEEDKLQRTRRERDSDEVLRQKLKQQKENLDIIKQQKEKLKKNARIRSQIMFFHENFAPNSIFLLPKIFSF